MELIAPPEYLAATDEERAKVCNGCGPGNWKFDLISDDILGLSITPACNIHDWMYAYGKDRMTADVFLLANMVILGCQKSKLMMLLRLPVMGWYFLAVLFFGGRHFKGEKVQ